MRIRLSYTLSEKTPLYRGTSPLEISPLRSIQRGDSSNSSEIRFSSHAGTHIDAPYHFCPDGPSVSECLSEENVFSPVILLDIPCRKSRITVSDISSLEDHCDVGGVLIRTGMYQVRKSLPDSYISEYPVIDDAIPDYLRETCPNLRIFGIDTISVSHPEHKSTGHSCHRNFLCKKPGILILEDLDLSNPNLAKIPFTMLIYPLLFDKTDGTPVIVFAEL